jgi:tripartite-type tricarboxylate transporter receptor subunit TctC
MRWTARVSILLGIAVFAAAPAMAQTASGPAVADFYRGKTMSMIIPSSPGGDYDLRARMVAQYMSRYIPGNPTIVPRNMPGGGGITAANWLHVQAPRDGTVLETPLSTMPLAQAMTMRGVQFDVTQWSWIGNTTNSPNVISAWHTSGIKTIEDAKKREVILGAPGANTPSAYNPLALNALVGTKFKLIVAYPGGNDVNLALERGEVEARHNIWASWVSGHPQWLKEKKIVQLVQIGLVKHPDLPDVPLMMDLAKNPEDRAALKLMSSDVAFARPFATTPGVPADRVAALRRAFDATMTDADLLAECAKANRDLSPSTGEQVQAVVLEVLKAPAPVLAKVNTIITQAETLK